MKNDTLLKGVNIPEQGFIELMISSAGEVVQTGKSVRYDGVDCYQPVGPELIGSAIPAVDAVEVVRCRECKCYPKDFEEGTWNWCCGIGDDTKPNDFCSYGQRREDGLYESLKRGLEEAIAFENGEIECRTETREDGDA